MSDTRRLANRNLTLEAATRQADRIASFVRDQPSGATNEEISETLGIRLSSTCARVNELCHLALFEIAAAGVQRLQAAWQPFGSPRRSPGSRPSSAARAVDPRNLWKYRFLGGEHVGTVPPADSSCAGEYGDENKPTRVGHK